MPVFGRASLDQLATCEQRLQDVLHDAIEIVNFSVLKGHRGEAEQNAAFKSGRSKLPWPRGNHNAYPSRAVDIIPYLARLQEHYDWNDLIAFGRLMGVVQACAHRRGVKLRYGLDWDGDFQSVNRDPDESFLDAPHIELID